ncbi:hypothetical protein [Mycolicibacterium fluoranthenivorans]|nr:hypothetical protein [Mycolicibacterium fluoranthenivorans]
MTAPEASEPGIPALVGGHYGAALDNLRSTVKWLVASSGAVATVIVGGAQLVDYSDRGWLGTSLSAIAVAIALSLALYLLLAAARILTIPRKTVTELANAETLESDTAIQTGTFKDPGVEWILARRDYLLGTYSNVRAIVAAYGAIDAANIGENRDVVRDIERRIARIEEAIHYRDVSQAYDDLLAKFKWGARIFVGAVALFSIAGLFQTKLNDQPPKDDGHAICCPYDCAPTTTAPSPAVPDTDQSPPVTNGRG